MEFSYVKDGQSSVATYLKIRPGCYVRIDAVELAATGPLAGPDGKDFLTDKHVFVQISSGQVLPFDPCESAEEATEAVDKLIMMLEANVGRLLNRTQKMTVLESL